MNMQRNERAAGVLMSVTSLPSPYGIGTFGKEAFEFVDFLKACNHKYWQVLPLGPTTYGDSPYQSFSAFAGNPYLIDLDLLVKKGYLKKSYLLSVDWGDGQIPVTVSEEDALNGRYASDHDLQLGNECYVSYEKMFLHRLEALRVAYDSYLQLKQSYETEHQEPYPESAEIKKYVQEQKDWLDDYALFMALKIHFKYASWTEWDDEIKKRTAEGIAKYRTLLKDEITFWEFIQYEFDQQWSNLKKYANENGIQIIGDIPFYVGLDSADVWANSQDFQLDQDLVPTKVAGVPPDAFSDSGQKWGNPIYDWTTMKNENYFWWSARMKRSSRLYDVIRIDHFIAVVKYYTIPANMPDARNGEYEEGPGTALTDVINESIDDRKIIAEDLGVYVPEVAELLQHNDYMGMKVLSFAFGGDRKNPHLPYNYVSHCVVYGGTHDNETLMGYFESRPDNELAYAYDYLNTREKDKMVEQVFRVGYSSVADLVIFSTQDILKLGNWARMNEPSSMGTNWKWRMKKGQLTNYEIDWLKSLASIYGR